MTEISEDTVRAEVRAWLEANWNLDYGLVEWRLKLAETGWGAGIGGRAGTAATSPSAWYRWSRGSSSGIVNLTRSRRPSWPLSLERGQPYRRAKDFSAPDRRATHGRRIPPLLKLTMPWRAAVKSPNLPRSPLTDRQRPLFEHPPEPFLDQADDASITDPVLREANQPFLADRIEEAPNVGVDDPAHLRAADPDHQRIQRIVLAAPGSEPVREPQEIFLINLAQYGGGCSLDDLVLERRHGERALPAVGLRYVTTPGWLRPVPSPMDPGVSLRSRSAS
jgi:hypothetical protein